MTPSIRRLAVSTAGALSAVVIASLIATLPVNAREDDEALRLLARAVEQRGDPAAWEGVAALEVLGTLGANGRENAVRVLRDREGRVRFERRYRDWLLVFVDDGAHGRLLDFRADSFVLLEPAMREQLLQSVDLIAPTPESWARASRVERVAPGEGSTAAGGDRVTVRLTPTAGLPLDLAIDPETARIEEATYRYVDPEDGETYTMNVFLLEDLRVEAPGGQLFVSAYHEREEGTSVTSWIAEGAKALSSVDPAEFEPKL